MVAFRGEQTEISKVASSSLVFLKLPRAFNSLPLSLCLLLFFTLTAVCHAKINCLTLILPNS